MDLSLDRDKLKIKHFLGIQAEMPGYPTLEDFLFELVNLLIEKDSLYDDDICFNYTKWTICQVKDKNIHLKHFEELHKQGYLEETHTDNNMKKYPKYKLLKHPWMTSAD